MLEQTRRLPGLIRVDALPVYRPSSAAYDLR